MQIIKFYFKFLSADSSIVDSSNFLNTVFQEIQNTQSPFNRNFKNLGKAISAFRNKSNNFSHLNNSADLKTSRAINENLTFKYMRPNDISVIDENYFSYIFSNFQITKSFFFFQDAIYYKEFNKFRKILDNNLFSTEAVDTLPGAQEITEDFLSKGLNNKYLKNILENTFIEEDINIIQYIKEKNQFKFRFNSYTYEEIFFMDTAKQIYVLKNSKLCKLNLQKQELVETSTLIDLNDHQIITPKILKAQNMNWFLKCSYKDKNVSDLMSRSIFEYITESQLNFIERYLIDSISIQYNKIHKNAWATITENLKKNKNISENQYLAFCEKVNKAFLYTNEATYDKNLTYEKEIYERYRSQNIKNHLKTEIEDLKTYLNDKFRENKNTLTILNLNSFLEIIEGATLKINNMETLQKEIEELITSIKGADFAFITKICQEKILFLEANIKKPNKNINGSDIYTPDNFINLIVLKWQEIIKNIKDKTIDNNKEIFHFIDYANNLNISNLLLLSKLELHILFNKFYITKKSFLDSLVPYLKKDDLEKINSDILETIEPQLNLEQKTFIYNSELYFDKIVTLIKDKKIEILDTMLESLNYNTLYKIANNKETFNLIRPMFKEQCASSPFLQQLILSLNEKSLNNLKNAQEDKNIYNYLSLQEKQHLEGQLITSAQNGKNLISQYYNINKRYFYNEIIFNCLKMYIKELSQSEVNILKFILSKLNLYYKNLDKNLDDKVEEMEKKYFKFIQSFEKVLSTSKINDIKIFLKTVEDDFFKEMAVYNGNNEIIKTFNIKNMEEYKKNLNLKDCANYLNSLIIHLNNYRLDTDENLSSLFVYLNSFKKEEIAILINKNFINLIDKSPELLNYFYDFICLIPLNNLNLLNDSIIKYYYNTKAFTSEQKQFIENNYKLDTIVNINKNFKKLKFVDSFLYNKNNYYNLKEKVVNYDAQKQYKNKYMALEIRKKSIKTLKEISISLENSSSNANNIIINLNKCISLLKEFYNKNEHELEYEKNIENLVNIIKNFSEKNNIDLFLSSINKLLKEMENNMKLNLSKPMTMKDASAQYDVNKFSDLLRYELLNCCHNLSFYIFDELPNDLKEDIEILAKCIKNLNEKNLQFIFNENIYLIINKKPELIISLSSLPKMLSFKSLSKINKTIIQDIFNEKYGPVLNIFSYSQINFLIEFFDIEINEFTNYTYKSLKNSLELKELKDKRLAFTILTSDLKNIKKLNNLQVLYLMEKGFLRSGHVPLIDSKSLWNFIVSPKNYKSAYASENIFYNFYINDNKKLKVDSFGRFYEENLIVNKNFENYFLILQDNLSLENSKNIFSLINENQFNDITEKIYDLLKDINKNQNKLLNSFENFNYSKMKYNYEDMLSLTERVEEFLKLCENNENINKLKVLYDLHLALNKTKKENQIFKEKWIINLKKDKAINKNTDKLDKKIEAEESLKTIWKKSILLNPLEKSVLFKDWYEKYKKLDQKSLNKLLESNFISLINKELNEDNINNYVNLLKNLKNLNKLNFEKNLLICKHIDEFSNFPINWNLILDNFEISHLQVLSKNVKFMDAKTIEKFMKKIIKQQDKLQIEDKHNLRIFYTAIENEFKVKKINKNKFFDFINMNMQFNVNILEYFVKKIKRHENLMDADNFIADFTSYMDFKKSIDSNSTVFLKDMSASQIQILSKHINKFNEVYESILPICINLIGLNSRNEFEKILFENQISIINKFQEKEYGYLNFNQMEYLLEKNLFDHNKIKYLNNKTIADLLLNEKKINYISSIKNESFTFYNHITSEQFEYVFSLMSKNNKPNLVTLLKNCENNKNIKVEKYLNNLNAVEKNDGFIRNSLNFLKYSIDCIEKDLLDFIDKEKYNSTSKLIYKEQILKLKEILQNQMNNSKNSNNALDYVTVINMIFAKMSYDICNENLNLFDNLEDYMQKNKEYLEILKQSGFQEEVNKITMLENLFNRENNLDIKKIYALKIRLETSLIFKNLMQNSDFTIIYMEINNILNKTSPTLDMTKNFTNNQDKFNVQNQTPIRIKNKNSIMAKSNVYKEKENNNLLKNVNDKKEKMRKGKNKIFSSLSAILSGIIN
jgi:hypothetical protein